MTETWAPDSTDREHPCPCWMRITAMMRLVPFTADTPQMLDYKRRSEDIRRGAMRKTGSIPLWMFMEDGLHEFYSMTALSRRVGRNNGRTAWKALRNAERKARQEGRKEFDVPYESGVYHIYMEEPKHENIDLIEDTGE